MKILVIGSNSFSGQDFVRHSLSQGDKVFCVSRNSHKSESLIGYRHGDCDFHQYDLNKDTNKIIDIILEKKITHIVNFAAQSIVEHSWNNPDHWYNTNTVSLCKLFKRFSQVDFIEKYIQISTPEVYGATASRITPSKNYKPTTPYAASKAAGDTFINMYAKHIGVPVSFVRSSNVYGKYQQFFKIIPKCIISILLNKKLPLHGGGLSRRDFIHIRDVSVAEHKILKEGNDSQVYHISTEKEVSILGLIKLICNVMNKKIEDVVEIAPDRAGKDAAYILDSSKTREMDWSPQIGLEEGVKETIQWLEKVDLSHISLEYEHQE